MLLNKDKVSELRNSEIYSDNEFRVKKNKRKINFDFTFDLTRFNSIF